MHEIFRASWEKRSSLYCSSAYCVFQCWKAKLPVASALRGGSVALSVGTQSTDYAISRVTVT